MDQKEWVSATITLPVSGSSYNIELKVPGWPVKPQVMLPIFQTLANTLSELAEQDAAIQHQRVSCRKGCGACCRQPVPLSEVEVYFIALIVAQQAEPRRNELVRRFNNAAAHFQNAGWFGAYSGCRDKEELKALVRSYFAEHVACPFLEDESCSIHPYRPIACREFLVTSDPKYCATEAADEVRRLPLSATLTDGLSKMARSRSFPGNTSFLPMVFALAWAEQFPESYPEKTGVEWLAEFCG